MGKVIKITSKTKKEKVYAMPNDHYKISESSKKMYVDNYLVCLELFLVQPGEYPTLEELENMPVFQARKIMKKLDQLYDEKANERSVNLTGKTLSQRAADKIDAAFKDLLKD